MRFECPRDVFPLLHRLLLGSAVAVCLVHRLAYNGDVAAGQLAAFQGGPSRAGGKAPISGLIRAERAAPKNSQLAAAQKVALKMPAAALLVGYVPPQFLC
jgi:hypothetical protein